MPYFFTISILAMLANSTSAGTTLTASPILTLPDTTKTGAVQIRWTFPEENAIEGMTYELQSSKTPDFLENRPLYKGFQRSSFLSGMESGKYFFRVRALAADSVSSWSDTHSLTVKHIKPS